MTEYLIEIRNNKLNDTLLCMLFNHSFTNLTAFLDFLDIKTPITTETYFKYELCRSSLLKILGSEVRCCHFDLSFSKYTTDIIDDVIHGLDKFGATFIDRQYLAYPLVKFRWEHLLDEEYVQTVVLM